MQISISLPEGFLDPETRCGFHITEKRKKIWAVELDLLDQFSKICEKHHLTYYLDGGTLLGAVRHQGFIPWDDDVDVIMPRDDYNRLSDLAPLEFQPPYFFQTSLTETGFFRTHAQLRNSSTTGCIPIDAQKEQINKGIWLDIFVLDGVADKKLSRHFQKRRIQLVKNLLRTKYDVQPGTLYSIPRKLVYLYSKIYYRHHSFQDLFMYFDRQVLPAYSDQQTAEVGDLTLRWRENCIWSRSDYAGTCQLPFEFLSLSAPVGYRNILRKQYGDYMSFPAEIVSTHGETIFDPDIPYTEFDILAALEEFESRREQKPG